MIHPTYINPKILRAIKANFVNIKIIKVDQNALMLLIVPHILLPDQEDLLDLLIRLMAFKD